MTFSTSSMTPGNPTIDRGYPQPLRAAGTAMTLPAPPARDHAALLRAHGEARFGGRFRAPRRILRAIGRA